MLCALLNDKAINRSVWAVMTFLSLFCLLAAVNPCPCGYLLNTSHKCCYTSSNVEGISKNFLDLTEYIFLVVIMIHLLNSIPF